MGMVVLGICFAVIKIYGLIQGKNKPRCTGSLTEPQVFVQGKLLEYASNARWMGVALSGLS
ncbi:MAG: hypothetical protein WCA22_09370 [Candidatus Binatus sp.]